MSFRRPANYEDEDWNDSYRSPPKRGRNAYAVSDSEQEPEGDDDGYEDRFQNPDAFLSRFGGYESDNSEDPDDDEEEELDPRKGM